MIPVDEKSTASQIVGEMNAFENFRVDIHPLVGRQLNKLDGKELGRLARYCENCGSVVEWQSVKDHTFPKYDRETGVRWDYEQLVCPAKKWLRSGIKFKRTNCSFYNVIRRRGTAPIA